MRGYLRCQVVIKSTWESPVVTTTEKHNKHSPNRLNINNLLTFHGGMEGEGQKNLTETLNSLEGAGGMEEEKYALLHYFVLFQSSKICWRNGGRGTE